MAFSWQQFSRYALVATILLAAGALSACYFEMIVVPREKNAAFHEYMAQSRILGQTPTQIFTTFGKPAYDSAARPVSTLPKNERLIIYDGPAWEACLIQFTDNKASQISYLHK